MSFLINLSRFSEQIQFIEKYPVEENRILLYGSSFFAHWGYERAKKQMSEASEGKINVINHGFGGATADELLYYYNRLVLPYKPSAIIWRGAPNDIFAGFSSEQAWELSLRVFEWAKKDLPGIKIGILCVFDFKSAEPKNRILFKEYDEYAKKYAVNNQNVEFLDINEFFYERKEDIGTYKNFRDLFIEDGLHLNDKAYSEFAVYFSRLLISAGF